MWKKKSVIWEEREKGMKDDGNRYRNNQGRPRNMKQRQKVCKNSERRHTTDVNSVTFLLCKDKYTGGRLLKTDWKKNNQ